MVSFEAAVLRMSWLFRATFSFANLLMLYFAKGKMVCNSGRLASRTLISVSGVRLDEELVSVSRRCKDNMQEFLESSGNDLSSRRKFQRIFVLPEEKENTKHWTTRQGHR
uniref:Uncharacterized protein n=1 Tax=Magallana gigas TaxID=29159 RepID=A0A8W8HRG6_MAGGI